MVFISILYIFLYALNFQYEFENQGWEEEYFLRIFRRTSFFFLIYFYLFLAALGLSCCTWAFSSCSERGLHFVAVRRLLIAVASLVAEHGL